MDWSSAFFKALPSLLYTGAALYESRKARKQEQRINAEYERGLQEQLKLLEGQQFTLEQMRLDLARREQEAKQREVQAEKQVEVQIEKEQEVKKEAKAEAVEEEVKGLTRRRGKRSVTTSPSGGMGFFDEYFA
jgi:preprotein translocase subunit SecF